MASACLPFLFRAVEIDGVPYWDGGYMANPAIFPFFGATATEDVLVVQINPVERSRRRSTQTEIMNRINEITFNSSLLAEFRAIDFVTRMIDQGKLPHGTGRANTAASTCIASRSTRRSRAHRRSKLNSDFDFFEMLQKGGRQAAQNFSASISTISAVRSTDRSRRRGEGRVGVIPPRSRVRIDRLHARTPPHLPVGPRPATSSSPTSRPLRSTPS
jgi:predicted acylesterase/phospholipase RssA